MDPCRCAVWSIDLKVRPPHQEFMARLFSEMSVLNATLILVVLLGTLVLMLRRIGVRNPFVAREPQFNPTVTVGDLGIHCYFSDDVVLAAWDQLGVVAVRTTDEGPFIEDVYFVFQNHHEEPLLAVPQCADGTQTLVEAIQQLPGFDDENFIRAMGSTVDAWFECWKGEVPGDWGARFE